MAHCRRPAWYATRKGLTIYRASRIRYQWRWQDMKSVTRHGILKTLRIESKTARYWIIATNDWSANMTLMRKLSGLHKIICAE